MLTSTFLYHIEPSEDLHKLSGNTNVSEKEKKHKVWKKAEERKISARNFILQPKLYFKQIY